MQKHNKAYVSNTIKNHSIKVALLYFSLPHPFLPTFEWRKESSLLTGLSHPQSP